MTPTATTAVANVSAMSSAPVTGLAPHPLLVLQLRGSQADMGEQHGRLLRAHGGWRPAYEFYPDLPERVILARGSGGERDAPAAFRIAKELLLWRMESKRPKAYVERSRAFAEAVGVPRRYARYLMVMDVLQNLVGLAGRFGVGPFGKRALASAVPACSTLSVWDGASAGGSLRHARNFDFPGIGVWDQAPAVVFCEPDEGVRYGFVTTRGADTPGVTAFNEAGLVLTAHTRFHRDVRFDGAAVIDLGHDIVRRAETIDDAVRIAAERPVSSSWGFAVSSGRERRAVVLETTGKRVAVVEPEAGADHLTCANRYRHPDTMRGEVAATSAWEEHSDGRQARLEALIEGARAGGGMDVEGLQAVLADRTEPGGEGERGSGSVLAAACTVKSIVAEPEAGVIHLSVGVAPASYGPWKRVAWEWTGQVGARVDDGGVGERREPVDGRAHAHFVAASRIAAESHDFRAALVELEAAIDEAPDDPAYRFLAGALQLRYDDARAALAHFDHGLRHERIEFRRGQLLLWASRAAARAGLTERAAELRKALAATTEPKLAPHRRAARLEATSPTFAKSRLRLTVNLILADAQLL